MTDRTRFAASPVVLVVIEKYFFKVTLRTTSSVSRAFAKHGCGRSCPAVKTSLRIVPFRVVSFSSESKHCHNPL